MVKTISLRLDGQTVHAPSLEDWLKAYRDLEHEFNAILVLTLSGYLLPAAEIARKAALQHGGKAHITILDSKQAGPGLGVLAYLAAQAILTGASLVDVEEQVRAVIPHIYTLFHIDAESLAHYGDFSPTSTDEESLGSFPLLALEDGQFAPYKKVRTRRHLLESFQEFIEEFETPQQITFLRGRGNTIRSRPLRELARERFPEVPFSEMEMSLSLTRLLGIESVGVMVMEIPLKKP